MRRPGPAAGDDSGRSEVPNFRGKTKRQVMEESSALGVRVEIAGTGIARRQEPQPGSVLRPGERVKVRFAR